MYPDLARFQDGDEEEMRESLAFEVAATPLFNGLDEVMETMESGANVPISILQRMGAQFAALPNFTEQFIKVDLVLSRNVYYYFY